MGNTIGIEIALKLCWKRYWLGKNKFSLKYNKKVYDKEIIKIYRRIKFVIISLIIRIILSLYICIYNLNCMSWYSYSMIDEARKADIESIKGGYTCEIMYLFF